MKRLYKIPCMGKVLKEKPLTGDPKEPLCSIPLAQMARAAGIKGLSGYECLEYNLIDETVLIRAEVDNEADNWIKQMMPTLKQVAKDKGYKLDKSKLEKK